LSDYAIEQLRSLVRVVGCPYVFARLDTHNRWINPQGPFDAGRKKAKLEWIGFHDSRHFQATQWVMRGIDLRTVQELLGHSDITTTMRYSHFAPSHAMRSIAEVQKAEAADVEKARATNGRQAIGSEGAGETSPVNLLIAECRKEDSNLHPLARTRT